MHSLPSTSFISLVLSIIVYFCQCRCVELEREAVRCFNCGSYSHALRECKRQWNYEAINSARSNHAAKRTFSSGPRSVARYYEALHSNEVSLTKVLVPFLCRVLCNRRSYILCHSLLYSLSICVSSRF